jgi:hypothetical protein
MRYNKLTVFAHFAFLRHSVTSQWLGSTPSKSFAHSFAFSPRMGGVLAPTGAAMLPSGCRGRRIGLSILFDDTPTLEPHPGTTTTYWFEVLFSSPYAG